MSLNEAGDCGFVRIESRNRLNETCHRERVPDASLAAHQMQRTTLSRQLNRSSDQRRDTRTVDLWYAIQVDHHFASAPLHYVLQDLSQLLGGFPDGQATVYRQKIHAVGILDGNLHWQTFGHRAISLSAESFTKPSAGSQNHVGTSPQDTTNTISTKYAKEILRKGRQDSWRGYTMVGDTAYPTAARSPPAIRLIIIKMNRPNRNFEVCAFHPPRIIPLE